MAEKNRACKLLLDTSNGILTLDGVDMTDCATKCVVEYTGGTTAQVTITLLADVTALGSAEALIF